MEKSYNHLKPEERATVMLMMREGEVPFIFRPPRVT